MYEPLPQTTPCRIGRLPDRRAVEPPVFIPRLGAVGIDDCRTVVAVEPPVLILPHIVPSLKYRRLLLFIDFFPNVSSDYDEGLLFLTLKVSSAKAFIKEPSR